MQWRIQGGGGPPSEVFLLLLVSIWKFPWTWTLPPPPPENSGPEPPLEEFLDPPLSWMILSLNSAVHDIVLYMYIKEPNIIIIRLFVYIIVKVGGPCPMTLFRHHSTHITMRCDLLLWSRIPPPPRNVLFLDILSCLMHFGLGVTFCVPVLSYVIADQQKLVWVCITIIL